MIEKFKYIRSKRLMEMYREIPCQHTGVSDGTVCGAHSNQSKHGKGRGIKASDQYCASLSADAHAWLDFGPASREEKIEMWDKAHEKTVKALTDKFGQEYLDIINAL
jgi:hypothetical protein